MKYHFFASNLVRYSFFVRFVPQWHFANLSAYDARQRNKVISFFVLETKFSFLGIGFRFKSLEILFTTSLFSCPGSTLDAFAGAFLRQNSNYFFKKIYGIIKLLQES